MTVLAVCLRFGRGTARAPDPGTMGRSWLWGGVLGGTAVTLAVGVMALLRQQFFGESAYFLTQLDSGVRLGRPLYTGVQFAYGPLLYGWPALWMKLGLPTLTAYLAALVLLQLVGYGLLFYVVEALPIGVWLRRFAFGAAVLGTASITLGENYSVFRVAVALAVPVLVANTVRLRWAVVTAAFGVALGFSVSAEIGVACLGGVLAVAAVRAAGEGWHSSWIGLAGVAGAGIFLAVAGPAYLLELRAAGRGGFDLLLTPEPRTVLYLVAAVGLAPIALARYLRPASRVADTAVAGRLAGIYGATLGMLPVVLGRSDAVHEFFFGLGAMLLSIVAGAPGRSCWAKAWLVWVALHAVAVQRANYVLYRAPLRALLSEPPGGADGFDLPALEALVAGHPVAVLDYVPLSVHNELVSKGLLAPSFYFALSAVWDAEAEQRKVQEMRQSEFALTRSEGLTDATPFGAGKPALWHRLYRQRQQPFTPGRLIDRELYDHWTPVGSFDGYVLLRKVD